MPRAALITVGVALALLVRSERRVNAVSVTVSMSNPVCLAASEAGGRCSIKIRDVTAAGGDASFARLEVSIDGKLRAYVSGFFESSAQMIPQMLPNGLVVPCGAPNASGYPGFGKSYDVRASAYMGGGESTWASAVVLCPPQATTTTTMPPSTTIPAVTSTTVAATTTTVTEATTTTTLLPAGSCADPLHFSAREIGTASFTVSISASDALFVLRAAVGSESCVRCVCDVDGSGVISATDALLTLKAAVGQPVVLRCPSCD